MKKVYVFLVILLLIIFQFMSTLIVKKPLKIGATYMNMNNPYFITLNNSIKQVIDAKGDILITRDPSQNQDRQNEIILEMIEEKIDILILQPVDRVAVQPAIDACIQNDIPIIVVDSQVFNDEGIIFTVLSDNYSAGLEIAKNLKKQTNSADILLLYDTSINSNNLRMQGFMDGIKGDDNYKVILKYNNVEGLEESMQIMESLITVGKEFDVVIGANDPTALGILSALQKMHIDEDILLYGVDGSPNGKLMISKGYMVGSSAQYPYKIGKIAADNLYKFLEGDEIEKEIIVDVKFIDSTNISEFNIKGWQ